MLTRVRNGLASQEIREVQENYKIINNPSLNRVLKNLREVLRLIEKGRFSRKMIYLILTFSKLRVQ